MKYLIAVVVVVGLLWLLRLQRRRPPPPPDRPPSARDAAGGPPALMARCAVCGVHLAERDAVSADGETFCSDEHRLEHGRRRG